MNGRTNTVLCMCANLAYLHRMLEGRSSLMGEGDGKEKHCVTTQGRDRKIDQGTENG